MKNLILLTTLLVSISFQISAQLFEGEINFKMTYKNIPEEMKQMKSMLPKKAKVILKKHKSKMIQKMGPLVKMQVISDSKTNKTTILVNALGNKIGYNTVPKMSDTNYTVTKSKQTKSILGYTCKKIVLTDKEKNKIEIWYTNKLPSYSNKNIPITSFKGCVLETTITKSGMTITMSADKISKKTVKDSEFIIPKGYTMKTEKEIEEMFKGF